LHRREFIEIAASALAAGALAGCTSRAARDDAPSPIEPMDAAAFHAARRYASGKSRMSSAGLETPCCSCTAFHSTAFSGEARSIACRHIAGASHPTSWQWATRRSPMARASHPMRRLPCFWRCWTSSPSRPWISSRTTRRCRRSTLRHTTSRARPHAAADELRCRERQPAARAAAGHHRAARILISLDGQSRCFIGHPLRLKSMPRSGPSATK